MIEKTDIRAIIMVECAFNVLQLKVLLSFNIKFQRFKVSYFSI